MKKIITIIGLVAIANSSLAQIVFQSNFQIWGGGLPTDWTGSGSTIANPSVLQAFTGSTFGTYMAGLQNSTAIGTGLATQNTTVTAGAKYKLEVFVKSTQGEMAIGYYDVTNSTYGPISTYRNVASPGSITVIDSITVPATCTSIQFMIYAKNTPAFGIGNIGVNLDRVVVTFMSGPPVTTYAPKTIYEIQHTTLASGDSPYKDSLVETTGIVTGTYSNGYFIQDSAKSWNGVYVFDNTNTPSRGDEVTVRAEVDEFFDLTELKNVDTMMIVSTGNTLPIPVGINTTELSTEEKYEGVLCTVSTATCTNASAGNGEWHIMNSADTGVVDDLMYAFMPTLGQKYHVTGVVHYSFGNYKIEPRDSLDVVRINSTSINENELSFSIYPNPVNTVITISGLSLEKAKIYSVNGKLIKTVSLSTINNTIDVTDLEKGIYIIKVTDNNKVGMSRFIKQ